MTKKSHIVYSIISICAIVAYCGFLVKNSISQVDVVEETLPYEYEEDFVISEIVTEPVVQQVVTIEEEVPHIATEPEAEPETEPTELRGFSPVYPVEGTVTKTFTKTHVYNEETRDWRAHCGIDISADPAKEVLAVEDGAVTACYEDALWGNVIEIDHGEYVSIYKNVSTLIMVKEGDLVTRGEKISGVGQKSAREASPPHIHFELKYYGEYVNPQEFLN